MIREKMQNIPMKRVVILSIPYLIIFYLADKCFWLYRHCIGDSMIEKIGVMLMNFQLAFTNWLPSFHMQDLLGGLVTAFIFRLILYYKVKNAKKFRHGEEYGSARWGNQKDIEPFVDPIFENNIILTETERLDSLINAKYCIATKLDIKFEVVVHIPMQLPFHGADISVLLGNILDNAIEAAIKIPEENRYIKCFMRYENSVLIITVINAFSGKVLKGKNGKLITNKSDSGNHGIGLESVNKIANKYHGSAIIEIKEETFVIKVVLYDLGQKLHGTS